VKIQANTSPIAPLTVRINDACRRAGVSRSTINRAFNNGDLTPIRKGSRMTFVALAELDRWILGKTE
jgi:predicted DNA-binding transcriptional regulator AlpA